MTALLTLLFIAGLVFLMVRALSGLGTASSSPTRPDRDGVQQWSDDDDAPYADYSDVGDDACDGGDGGSDGGDCGGDGGDGGGGD